jgi:hypothetical protein
MLQFGMSTKLVSLARMTTSDSAFQVRTQSELTETVSINKGLKQGAGLAPLLFNSALESATSNPSTDANDTLIHYKL